MGVVGVVGGGRRGRPPVHMLLRGSCVTVDGRRSARDGRGNAQWAVGGQAQWTRPAGAAAAAATTGRRDVSASTGRRHSTHTSRLVRHTGQQAATRRPAVLCARE